jgi:hypothetical protein
MMMNFSSTLFLNDETKEQAKQCMHTHSPNKPKNCKQTSARKLMVAVFWGRKGVLMVQFMKEGTTIMSEVYGETLKKLCKAIQNKRRGMLRSSVVLPHDNAHLHTSCLHLSSAGAFQLGVI